MSRLLIPLLILTIALAATWGVRSQKAGAAPKAIEPEDRVAHARLLREGKIRKLCSDRKLSYPPQELFLRAIKREQILEVWAGQNQMPLQLLTSYPLTAYSGQLGPKRREGDRQIPEGVYRIDRFNPKSLYHLSLGLNYPNDSDRRFADPERPGSDIFIHGRAASVGCLAIGDEAIEELYLLALDASGRKEGTIPVHIFPARMNSAEWEAAQVEEAVEKPELLSFWSNLQPIYADFEKTRRKPEVIVNENGQYQLRATLR